MGDKDTSPVKEQNEIPEKEIDKQSTKSTVQNNGYKELRERIGDLSQWQHQQRDGKNKREVENKKLPVRNEEYNNWNEENIGGNQQ